MFATASGDGGGRSSDLRNESLALLANVLSGRQAAGVERRVGARDGRGHVAQPAHRCRRARRGRFRRHYPISQLTYSHIMQFKFLSIFLSF